MWFAYGMAWFSTSLAVIAGMYLTHSAKCLWLLLVLVVMLIHAGISNNKKDVEEE